MEVRPVRPDEYEALGTLTVEAYRPMGVATEVYSVELADVAGRASAATVLVAVDDDGALLGGITYVPPGPNAMAEHVEDGIASIRMLAVSSAAQRRGVGLSLTEAVLDLARADGAVGMVLHSTQRMTPAHRLYEGLGFVREPAIDWCPEPDVECLGFRLWFTPPSD